MREPFFEPGSEEVEPLIDCEYFLIEYAPSPLRNTRVAIGLFLFDVSGQLVRQGFTRDWRRVRCLDPQSDLALLANLPQYFEQTIRAAAVSGRLRQPQAGAAGPLYTQLLQMREDFSGSLQISQPRGVRTSNPEREFERLFQEHIDRPAHPGEKRSIREGSRPWIHAQLAEALQRHALWERMSRDVPVQDFTAAGDGFRIDFAYRPNGTTKYLHAISLDRDWNQSKLLGYTFWRIREKSKAEMTAIVADAAHDLAVAQSCRQILAGARIAIQPLSELDSYLEVISRELR